MEQEYDVDYRLFGEYFVIRVKAASCDEAMAKVNNMNILDLLKDKPLTDFGYTFGARTLD